MIDPKGAESADLAALVGRVAEAICCNGPCMNRRDKTLCQASERDARAAIEATGLEALSAENAGLREALRDIADGNKLPDDLIAHGREHFREHGFAALQHKAREALALSSPSSERWRAERRVIEAARQGEQMMLDYGKAIHLKSMGVVAESEALRATCLAWAGRLKSALAALPSLGPQED